MKRKHFLLTALTGLVAAILPKRGESASKFLAPGIPSGASAGATGDIKGCSGCGLIETCKCIAPVTVPEPKNVLCIHTTHDGYTVVPKYRGTSCDDPLAHFCTIGVKWRDFRGVQYGAWFDTEDEDMLFDTEALLYAVRNSSGLGNAIIAGADNVCSIPSDEVARLRAEYRAHIAETTQALFHRPERTAAGSLLSL